MIKKVLRLSLCLVLICSVFAAACAGHNPILSDDNPDSSPTPSSTGKIPPSQWEVTLNPQFPGDSEPQIRLDADGNPACSVYYYRVEYMDTVNPTYSIFDSASSLPSSLCSIVDSQKDQKLGEIYTNEFFEEHFIIVLQTVYSSGSITQKLTSIVDDGGSINISLISIIPEICTDDMARWITVIELSRQLFSSSDEYQLFLDETPVQAGGLDNHVER